MSINIKIKITTKKLVSIIVPRIGGIILYRIIWNLKGKISFYVWAFAIPGKIWTGFSEGKREKK